MNIPTEVYVIASIVLVIFAISFSMNLSKAIAERSKAAQREIDELDRELDNMKIKHNIEIEKQKSEIEKRHNALLVLEKQKTKGFPWLADAYAQYVDLMVGNTVKYLMTKPHKASRSAEIVSEIKGDLKETERRFRITKALLEYYEYLFPWLDDFREGDDIDDFIRLKTTKEAFKNDDEDLFDRVKYFLTEAEYAKLLPVERNEIALERYWKEHKNSFEVGRMYERYIGFLYEKEGWKVEYVGSILGPEDHGRDLIVSRSGDILIIQCKYWSKNKTIRENHINQLFGTTVKYCIDHLMKGKYQVDMFSLKPPIKPVFWTSTSFSQDAVEFAHALYIELHENIPMERYPCVKCNVNRVSGEKIYHLPFDQQYDHVIIEPERGESYVNYPREAENFGFRRAFRWRGNKEVDE